VLFGYDTAVQGIGIERCVGIFVGMVFILEVKLKRGERQFQARLTELSALSQVVVQFRYNV